MDKFLKWWKTHGQLIGFLLLVGFIILTTFSSEIQRLGRDTDWFSTVWLAILSGGIGWYIWQMKVHGWRLPDDLKDTH